LVETVDRAGKFDIEKKTISVGKSRKVHSVPRGIIVGGGRKLVKMGRKAHKKGQGTRSRPGIIKRATADRDSIKKNVNAVDR